MKKIEVLKADITELDCDAIVNAANSSLLGGGGVDGAIHSKAGPKLFQACMELGGCPVGQARITPGFALKARYVIHAVGPRWKDGKNGEEEDLRSAYTNAMKLAQEQNIRSLAFPNISTGIFGFPKEKAAQIAIDTVKSMHSDTDLTRIVFTCFDDENFDIYSKLMK